MDKGNCVVDFEQISFISSQCEFLALSESNLSIKPEHLVFNASFT